MGKDVKGGGHALIFGTTEMNQFRRCLGSDFNRASPEYKVLVCLTTLWVGHTVRLFILTGGFV
jgi:hypothetical protein